MGTRMPLSHAIPRYLLVLVLVVFGSNQFLSFMPKPEPPPDGGAFLGALQDARYVFPTVGVVFLLSALTLFVNRAVGFGLVLLAPIAVNIILYHLQFDVAGIVPGLVLTTFLVVVAAQNAAHFRSLFIGPGDSK